MPTRYAGKSMRRCLFLLGFFFVFFFLFVPRAYAEVCYAARNIAQFACIDGEQECIAPYQACAGDPSRDCDHCDADGVYYFTGVGPCKAFCGGWETAKTCASTGSYLFACSAPPDCAAHPNITTCNSGLEPGTCTTNTEQWEYGCWGPGEGAPTSTPAPGNCPNGICDTSEDPCSCSADCGECSVILPTATPDPNFPTPTPTPGATPTPTPVPGSIRARAMQVSTADTSCTAVSASSTGVDGTVFMFTPSSASHPAPLTQSGSSVETCEVFSLNSDQPFDCFLRGL